MTKGRFGRQDRLIKEKHHDVYRSLEKFPEPTLCGECGALYTGGRWTWGTPPQKVNTSTCPACRRTADRFPAGTIEIRGEFFASHREEIVNLIQNVEKQEKTAHPMERIMELANGQGVLQVTTTGVHLARRIGEALSRSYKGDYSFQYGDGEKTLRVRWER